MFPNSRRSFLTASVVIATALVAPAHAASDPIACQVSEHRACWLRDEQKITQTLSHDPQTPVSEANTETLRTLARGLAALRVTKVIQAVPVAMQVHAEMQRLIRDLAQAMGSALFEADRLIEAWMLDPDQDEPTFRAVFGGLLAGVEGWDLSPEHKAMLRAPLTEITKDERPGALRDHILLAQRQVRRLMRAAERAATRPDSDRLLRAKDPALIAEVEGSPYRAEPTNTPFEEQEERRGRGLLLALGYFALGLTLSTGYVIVLVGYCDVACSGPHAWLYLLGGVVVVLLSHMGFIALARIQFGLPSRRKKELE